jgi:multisubunit Na+/H+ antiporter MnhG subunit
MRERPEELSHELIIRLHESTSCYGYSMEELSILRTFAGATTVLAAALVAANVNARITVAGFVIFIVASIGWMADGWLETKTSLVIPSVILLLINAIGVWRWFPKAEREAKS